MAEKTRADIIRDVREAYYLAVQHAFQNSNRGRPSRNGHNPIVVIGSFLLAFEAVLLEGSEVTILSLATVRRIEKRNVLRGVALGGLASVLALILVSTVFQFLSELLIDLAAGSVILYFSYRFLRGFVKYYFRGKSSGPKWKMEQDLVKKGLRQTGATSDNAEIPFSLTNSLPVFSITLTEGFEASLVLAAAGSFNMEWTAIGALVSICFLTSGQESPTTI